MHIASGAHGPCLHLQQLFEVAHGAVGNNDGTSTERLLLITEDMEAGSFAQVVGVSSFGGSGTNVYHVVWGMTPAEDRALVSRRPIYWFPSESTSQQEPAPEVEYWIMGTWTAWQKCCKMEQEADGVYGYT